VPFLAKKMVAVVGAHIASINGCRFARKIAADLGNGGLLVVSDMARGIDAAAHEGTIATRTLAVLGGGLDVMYPKENQSLYVKNRRRRRPDLRGSFRYPAPGP
jgi:DNA processing protein